MANRPNDIDLLQSNFNRPLYTPLNENYNASYSSSTPAMMPPPALSPLDAIQMQSQLLARRFEQEDSNGRRLSRLPVRTVATEFARSRPTYFRAMTTGSQFATIKNPPPGPPSLPKGALELELEPKPEPEPEPELESEVQSLQEWQQPEQQQQQVQQAQEPNMAAYYSILRNPTRPVSHYPQMVNLMNSLQLPERRLSTASNVMDYADTDSLFGSFSGLAYDAPESPVVPISSNFSTDSPRSSTADSSMLGSAPISSPNISPVKYSVGPTITSPSPSFSSSHLPLPPTIRQVRSEDALRIHSSEQTTSQTNLVPLEKPQPLFQREGSIIRSDSMRSETSATSSLQQQQHQQRSLKNFSRPMSRHSQSPTIAQTQLDSLSLPSSSASLLRFSPKVPLLDPPTTHYDISPQTPTSVADQDTFSWSENLPRPNAGPASYTYSKYALGRQQPPKRESVAIEDFISRQFTCTWDETAIDTDMTLALPSSLIDLSNHVALPHNASSPSSRRKLRKSRPNTPKNVDSSSGSTIKSLFFSSPKSNSDDSLESHVQLGIDLHNSGDIQKSSYHLHHGAKGGHSTAMVLYALACRHGWGMKPNLAETASWLQRVQPVKDDDTKNEQYQGQFAASVYELGVSYMKGWGMDQDKALSLKCFEIAANWGDSDALVEAAHCYQDGIGCKKDLVKSAQYYKKAEEKGVSLAGNSWIHKEKYNPPPLPRQEIEQNNDNDNDEGRGRMSRKSTGESTGDGPKKRDKSRTRAFFSRIKS